MSAGFCRLEVSCFGRQAQPTRLPSHSPSALPQDSWSTTRSLYVKKQSPNSHPGKKGRKAYKEFFAVFVSSLHRKQNHPEVCLVSSQEANLARFIQCGISMEIWGPAC